MPLSSPPFLDGPLTLHIPPSLSSSWPTPSWRGVYGMRTGLRGQPFLHGLPLEPKNNNQTNWSINRFKNCIAGLHFPAL